MVRQGVMQVITVPIVLATTLARSGEEVGKWAAVPGTFARPDSE
jgi:hypothetical protein